MITDSHCHLSFPELAGDLQRILAAMAEAQVSRALCICTTLEEFPAVAALASTHDNFWATVGVHPDNEGLMMLAAKKESSRVPCPVFTNCSAARSALIACAKWISPISSAATMSA